MKKVLIITSSLRKGSNSDTLAAEFARGAEEAGNVVEVISLADKDIRFCRGCLTCQKNKRCFMRDDADLIEEKMGLADVLVFATPIYYYEMSGQLKTMLDRGNPLYHKDYSFRDVYFLSVAAEDEPTTPERAEHGFGGWVECFENATLKGTVFAGGVNDIGDIAGHVALKKAYDMGKSV